MVGSFLEGHWKFLNSCWVRNKIEIFEVLKKNWELLLNLSFFKNEYFTHFPVLFSKIIFITLISFLTRHLNFFSSHSHWNICFYVFTVMCSIVCFSFTLVGSKVSRKVSVIRVERKFSGKNVNKMFQAYIKLNFRGLKNILSNFVNIWSENDNIFAVSLVKWLSGDSSVFLLIYLFSFDIFH